MLEKSLALPIFLGYVMLFLCHLHRLDKAMLFTYEISILHFNRVILMKKFRMDTEILILMHHYFLTSLRCHPKAKVGIFATRFGKVSIFCGHFCDISSKLYVLSSVSSSNDVMV